jgi:hypothetical protein
MVEFEEHASNLEDRVPIRDPELFVSMNYRCGSYQSLMLCGAEILR